MNTAGTRNKVDFMELGAQLAGTVLLPENAAYDEARQLWNARISKCPGAIARCTGIQDVLHAVRWARSHDVPLSVRAGGHDFAGRSLCDQGLVIDCSQMRGVFVDPRSRTARAECGATIGGLIEAAQRYGLATATGTVSSVGLGGLTLGGGYGPLLGKCGLVADNLLSAQVVTADGRLITANEIQHADLYWALRGGGGNFGVVVSFEYRLHPISQVLSGLLLYPMDQASDVLGRFGEFIKTAPDELTVQSGFLTLPDGFTALFLSPTYCGPLNEGGRILEPLRALGKPIADQIRLLPYNELIHSLDAFAPKGNRYFLQTQSIAALSPATTEILVRLAQQFSSPLSALSFHHFHGAASRVPVASTAFGTRQDHLMLEIIAAWDETSAAGGRRHMAWAQKASADLAPYALPGGYINLLDVAEQERVPQSFGSNHQRLLEVKQAYDPDDIFHSTVGHIAPRLKEAIAQAAIT